jgi:hypothetical protein
MLFNFASLFLSDSSNFYRTWSLIDQGKDLADKEAQLKTARSCHQKWDILCETSHVSYVDLSFPRNVALQNELDENNSKMESIRQEFVHPRVNWLYSITLFTAGSLTPSKPRESRKYSWAYAEHPVLT